MSTSSDSGKPGISARRHITVIIATLAKAERADTLERAIRSVLDQEGVTARPLVVINGTAYADSLRGRLAARLDLDCVYVEQGNLGNAHRVGVEKCTTPYFSFLDDDDVLLPGGLAALVDALEGDDTCDFAVGNGLVELPRGQREAFAPYPSWLDKLRADPARTIVSWNWLASCGGVYRRDRIGTDIFDGGWQGFEWTDYGFRLSVNYRGAFVASPVFKVYDTPASESKSVAYLTRYCAFLEHLREVAGRLRPDLVPSITARMARAYNAAALAMHQHGSRGRAIALQLKGLRAQGGWRYIPALARLALKPSASRSQPKGG